MGGEGEGEGEALEEEAKTKADRWLAAVTGRIPNGVESYRERDSVGQGKDEIRRTDAIEMRSANVGEEEEEEGDDDEGGLRRRGKETNLDLGRNQTRRGKPSRSRVSASTRVSLEISKRGRGGDDEDEDEDTRPD